jgi:hypothetical protein
MSERAMKLFHRRMPAPCPGSNEINSFGRLLAFVIFRLVVVPTNPHDLARELIFDPAPGT